MSATGTPMESGKPPCKVPKKLRSALDQMWHACCKAYGQLFENKETDP
jgi:hypothetical protein